MLKNNKIILNLCYIALLSCTPFATIIADIDREQIKACESCHGKDGNSEESSIPSIAELSEDYIIDSMLSFQAGDRPASVVKRKDKKDTDMKKITKELKEADIEALAQHYAKKIFERKPQKFNPQQAATGRKLHRKYCEKCHEEDGRIGVDDVSILAGQKMKYLRITFEQYLKGERKMPKKMHKKIAALEKKHGQEGLEHLVHFYGSLM